LVRAAYRGLAFLLFSMAVVIGAVGAVGIIIGIVGNMTSAFSGGVGWETPVIVVILVPLIAGVWYGITVLICFPFLALGRKSWERSKRR